MSLSTSETKSAYFGIGRRKTSVAKVILVPGTGVMVVNHKQGEKYNKNTPMVLGFKKQVRGEAPNSEHSPDKHPDS